ncbi:MAG: microcin ABC transporter ATP-binding protein [Alphaproteobacteria bacterium CG_4_10_14_0_8_um_filter_53_9]|nr:MAG: microcin ABC transporter ATP-binding protein [Alphaproteobacteria bacterium CG_4_10_14_0_8_um_filter_53_9]
MALLDVRNLNIYTSDNKHLVKDVSFFVEEGECLAVVGESGSGKTLTALSLMNLLGEGLRVGGGDKADKPGVRHEQKESKRQAGDGHAAGGDASVYFNGTEILGLEGAAMRRLRGKDMAMIFQEPATALNPVMRCGAQVAEVFTIHTRLGRAEIKRRVLALFERVKLPDPARVWKAYPHELSGGQRQRVMIAMALALKPKLLIADEPTTALDVTVQAEILDLVREIRTEMGMAMLWITHDFGVVRALADRVMVMEHGVVRETGAVADVLAHPKDAYTKRLLSATLELKPVEAKAAITAPLHETVLSAENLSLFYEKKGGILGFKAQPVWALHDVSLTLGRGEILGVVGESGSGKSTLARVLTRLSRPTKPMGGHAVPSPHVVILGREILDLKGRELRAARRGMQMVFQDPSASLNPKMTIFDSIAEGVRAWAPRGRAAALPDGLPTSKDALRAYVEGLLAEVGLPADVTHRLPSQLSGGQKQRVAIARALALKPEILVCDEAVSALDVSVQSQILALLKKLQTERGLSMIFITHDLRVVSHLCDRVLVMQNGSVVETGPVASVLGAPREAYTQRLVSAVV